MCLARIVSLVTTAIKPSSGLPFLNQCVTPWMSPGQLLEMQIHRLHHGFAGPESALNQAPK